MGSPRRHERQISRVVAQGRGCERGLKRVGDQESVRMWKSEVRDGKKRLSEVSARNDLAHAKGRVPTSSSVLLRHSTQYTGTFRVGYTMLRVGLADAHSHVSAP